MTTTPPRLDRPLRFERVFLEKVWGGRRLAAAPDAGGLALDLPDGMQVGETWELVDRADVQSVVPQAAADAAWAGPFAGATLGELVRDHPGDLLGRLDATPEGRFPLLVKYIDAAEHLSVQVHPDDVRAADHADWEAKTEAWVVLGAADEGRIFHGFEPGTDPEAFAAACRTGAPVDAFLRAFAPRRGECFFVPGGTVHAIGAGVTLIEVQQNSDTTFRVNDWGRVGLDGKPRDLHVDQALACLDFGPAPEPVLPPADRARAPHQLAACDAFRMGSVALDPGAPLAGHTHAAAHGSAAADDGGGEPVVLAVVRGGGVLAHGGGSIDLTTGDVWLLPAALGAWRVEARGGPLGLVDMRGPAPA